MAQNPITTNLPQNTFIYLTVFSSSENMQQITVNDPSGNIVSSVIGKNDDNGLLGNNSFTTVAATNGAQEVAYTVEVQNSSDSGSKWVSSQLTSVGSFGLYTYHQKTITAGDTNDDSFDDCVVQFSWFTPST